MKKNYIYIKYIYLSPPPTTNEMECRMEIWNDFWNFIAVYKFVIILITVLLLTYRLFARIIIEEMQQRWHHKWVEKRNRRLEKKRLKKEKKQLEKKQKKYRVYKSNNALFSRIIKKHRTIIFKGPPGAGKTSLMELFTRFILDMFERNEKRNYRYNRLMKPNFIKQREYLKENKLLPVYTNMEGVEHPITGFKAMTNLDEVFKQRKKANTPCVLQIDEFNDSYGKELRHDMDAEKDVEKKRDYKGIKRSATKPRHYGFYILGTDQQGDDIIYIFRNIPHCDIEAKETKLELLRAGKRKQRRLILLQKLLPGWFVSERQKMYAQCLFGWQKFKLFFKLLLPGFLCNEKQFYINRDRIYSHINKKYTIMKTLWMYEGDHYWTYYKPTQSLKYDHLEYKSEYDDMFDADGNRKPQEAKA